MTELERVDYNHARWYRTVGETDPANFYASVTNILSVAQHRRLTDYKDRVALEVQEATLEASSALGTHLHNIIEQDLRNQLIPPTDLQYEGKNLTDYLTRWRTLRKENQIEATKIELMVNSKQGWAGTLDLVGTFKGKSAIMDLKSGRFSIKTGWQMGAYLEAYKEMTGEQDLGMVGLSVPWNAPMRVFEYRHLDFCLNAFLACYTVFKAMYWNDLKKMNWRYLEEEIVK